MKLAKMKPKRPALNVEVAAKSLVEESQVKISLRVPQSFRRRLRLLSVEQDREMQEMVVEALRTHYPELADA